MAFPQGPFDNSLLKDIDEARATRTENDDNVLQVLESLRELSSVSEYQAVPERNADGDFHVETANLPRTVLFSRNETIDKDQVTKLVESHQQDTKLATTMLGFANDLGEEHPGNAELTKIMRTLHRTAIPQIVTK
jgi:hypothetical protein